MLQPIQGQCMHLTHAQAGGRAPPDNKVVYAPNEPVRRHFFACRSWELAQLVALLGFQCITAAVAG